MGTVSRLIAPPELFSSDELMHGAHCSSSCNLCDLLEPTYSCNPEVVLEPVSKLREQAPEDK